MRRAFTCNSLNLPWAKEGYPFLAFSFAVSLGMLLIDWGVAVPCWLVFFFLLQFYRDPQRNSPEGPGLVLGPADGRVIAVGLAKDPYQDGKKSWKISIFMHAFNVHRTRVPYTGRVQARQDFYGSFFNAALDKASEKNERTALVIGTEAGSYACVQVAGLMARRIVCYAHVGDVLTRGAAYGFIHFGSRLDVYLPEAMKIGVSLGDKVKGGESIIAQLS